MIGRKFLFGLSIWLGFLLLAIATAQAATPAPTLLATSTPRIYPSRTPTPTATRRPPSGFNFNLSELVSFGQTLHGLFPCSFSSSTPPAVAYFLMVEGSVVENQVCLIGFPTGQTVTVKIYDPTNRLVATIPYYIPTPEDQGYKQDRFSFSFGPLPNSAKQGRWRITAKSPGVSAENYFYHPAPEASLTATRFSNISDNPFDSRRHLYFTIGDTLLLQGANFSPSQNLPAAIYRDTGVTDPEKPYMNLLTFMSGQGVRTNRNGGFEAGFSITPGFSAGRYIVALFPEPDKSNQISTYILFSVIKPWQACPGAQPSRLHPDNYAVVTAGSPNNLREKAGLGSRKIGQLVEFERVQIQKGPKCADGLVWWKVISQNTGLKGWTAEGDNGDYWLYPGW